jgi:hypothetical protein
VYFNKQISYTPDDANALSVVLTGDKKMWETVMTTKLADTTKLLLDVSENEILWTSNNVLQTSRWTFSSKSF